MAARTKMIGTKVTPAVHDVIARMAATQHKSVSEVASELLEQALATQGKPDNNVLLERFDKLEDKPTQLAQGREPKKDNSVRDTAGPDSELLKKLLRLMIESTFRNGQILSKILKMAGGANMYAQFAALHSVALNRSMKENRRLDDALEDEALQALMGVVAEFEEKLCAEIDKHLMKKDPKP